MGQLPPKNKTRQELLRELAVLRERLRRTEQALHGRPSRKAQEELKRRVEALTAEQRQKTEQLARIASELILTEHRERLRLAQLLHDHLQQLLVGAKYRAELLCRRVRDEQRGIAEDISGLLHETILACWSLTEELSPPVLHETGLAACMQWLVRRMREKRGLSVALSIDPEAARINREDIKVFLYQAVQELLLNVLTHAGVKEALVEITGHGGDRLSIMVSDAGRGFDPKAIWSRTSPNAGSFGLCGIRERLGLIGGWLQIDSAPQKGSRLTLIIPAGDGLSNRLDQSTATRQNKKSFPEPGPAADAATAFANTAGKKRILLVDDLPEMRQLIASALEEEEDLVIVGEAVNGQEAILKARELRPDLILMDSSMPGMDGIEATRIIHEEYPEIRIIGLSVDEEDYRSTKILQSGATSYVNKYQIFDALLAVIRQ